MKFGVPVFSYNHVRRFAKALSEHGLYTINLGDSMQTIAVRGLYRELGIADCDTLDVDRDSLAAYDGERVALVMNGCFFPWSFPISPKVAPVFIGFQTEAAVVERHHEYFRRHAPIGCRDTATTEIFKRYGIEAYTTGCLTMTLPRRTQDPAGGKTLIVYGAGAGAFPSELLSRIPPAILDTAEFVSQRKVVHRHPLTAVEMRDAERHAGFLLADYCNRAALVITPLHHAAVPCVASGIPVVLCRNDQNPRFSYLREIMPVYGLDNLSGIDWSPKPLDLTSVRSSLLERTRAALASAGTALG